jgi:heme O synthase-like polyprenyltransferase
LAWRLRVARADDEKAAMQLFAFSILYLFILFAVLLVESGLGSLFGRAAA